MTYLDDILLISPTFEKQLEDLERVFKRLRRFGLKANRDKCVFVRNEVKYLGHFITPEGIKPDPSKVAAILKMEVSVNLKHLKSFLQTCAWFRKFILNYSKVAEPLTKLTRKNEVWRWHEEQQCAFRSLKSALCEAPILIQADFNRVFLLRTVASNYAIGAVL